MSIPGSKGNLSAEENAQQHPIVNPGLHPHQPRTTSSLVEVEALPKRNPLLHWVAFVLAIVSFVFLVIWVFGARDAVPTWLVYLDIGMGVIFAAEFFTRSGFRWNRWGYIKTRFFDFIAIVPVLALVHHGWSAETIWVWIILVARTVRMIDRFLGDGFVRRNFLALLEGFEEEITDRVLDRIFNRIQADLNNAGFSHGIAAALSRNKASILKKVRDATPQQGLGPALVRVVGLDTVIEKAADRTFDVVTEVINSEEIDQAVRDAVDSAFSRMRGELGKKSWRQHLGIKRPPKA
jgi:hypothetical protein